MKETKMNENEIKRYCPQCGAEYQDNHRITFDGPQQRYQMICTVCHYTNAVPVGRKTIGELIVEVSQPWQPKED